MLQNFCKVFSVKKNVVIDSVILKYIFHKVLRIIGLQISKKIW
jgi:hypothetical protein